jgi:hypothetical protein
VFSILVTLVTLSQLTEPILAITVPQAKTVLVSGIYLADYEQITNDILYRMVLSRQAH